MSLEAVGNILVLALLITPAATARILTERLWAMTLLASLIGCAGSVAGLYVSYAYDLAAGGSVVVVLTGVFALAWCLAPRHGLLAKLSGARTPPLPRPPDRERPTSSPEHPAGVLVAVARGAWVPRGSAALRWRARCCGSGGWHGTAGRGRA